ncbi:MAG: hypothetical protein NDJ89_13330 [Oligoflexia bacterium]|nr:hypothetical protein [Oligoflexia bacterium]
MRQFLRNNGLGIVTFLLFAIFLVGQSIVGLHNHNQEQQEHGQQAVTYFQFLLSGEFIETVFENWEKFESFQNWQSEFLSVGVLVVLSIFLREKGSPESKDVNAPHDENPE